MKSKFFKKLLGRRLTAHTSQVLDHTRLYKKRGEPGRVLKFLPYYFYKIIKETMLDSKNNIVTVNDLSMKVIPNDIGISRELLIFKTHEPLVTDIIKNEIKQGMFCIDIGCNIGYYALLESKLVGDKGNIITFEPSPINFRFFNDNLKLNNITNVKAYNFAIGDNNSKINFLIADWSNASRVVEANYPTTNTEKIIPVAVKKLDTIIEEEGFSQVDFIRMDIEGYEFNAYEGMKNTIKKFKPKLLIEVHGNLMGIDKTIKFLNKIEEDGYDLKYYTPRKLDKPWIANKEKDVEEISIKTLIQLLKYNKIPNCFHIFLQ